MTVNNSRLKRFALDAGTTALICGVLIWLDAITKKWAYTSLYSAHSGKKDFIPGLLGFVYAENTGAAWSILEDAPWVFISLSIITVIAITLYIFVSSNTNVLLRASLLLLLSGGVGNLIDRLFRSGSHFGNRNGYVVDFLNFEFIDFPIFNVADVCVCVGMGLLILYMIIYEFRNEKTKSEANYADRG